MVEIEIFLSLREAQISFLSIPCSDIERLAIFPFRWIRYVMFAICGARGELSTTPNGPPVDYDETEFADAENTYYYRPSEDCAFVDFGGLDDRSTSTGLTLRRHNFRRDVIRRDGDACVVTRTSEHDCDAVHLIPRSKGEEYIERVIRLRSPRDNSGSSPNIGIDDMRNGILLRKDLHSKFGRGEFAFIKTPNYELRPEHIKRFRRGDSRQDYITLHSLQEPQYYDPTMLEALLQNRQSGDLPPGIAFALGANVDALFQGEGGSLPSTVILDYAYGVAAFKSWHSKRMDVPNVMKAYHEEHYAQIQPLPRGPSDDTDYTSGPDDDPTDPDCIPEPRKRYTSTTRRDESELAKAMDELNVVLMYIHGITPEVAAERRQKEIEQKERAAQEASRNKVMEWRKHLDV